MVLLWAAGWPSSLLWSIPTWWMLWFCDSKYRHEELTHWSLVCPELQQYDHHYSQNTPDILWHHNILYPSAFFPECYSLIFCSKDSEPASSSKNNLKCKKPKSFQKIRNISPTYLSLKMSCAVFSPFFLPTSFRGKSAFTLSRGAWHLSLTTQGISSISKRCCSIGGSGLLGWKALCCKHCKKQNSLTKVKLSIILKTFNVMPVRLTPYGMCKISSILNILPLYCWKIFCLTVDWKSMINCLRRLLMTLNKNTDADESSHTHQNEFYENY